MRQAGFTLIEFLIAAAILAVILLIVAQSLGSTGGMVNKYVSRTELLEDTRTAGQLIADEVAKAVYIYTPGATISLGTGYTLVGPATPGGVGTVGQNFLAFIEGPRNLSTAVACDPTKDAVASATANREACLLFVAYYPVLRSSVVNNATGNAQIPVSPQNSNRWTIFEFRTWLNGKALVSGTAVPGMTTNIPKSFSGISGNLLADFIDPNNGFKVVYTGETGAENWCRTYASTTATTALPALCSASSQSLQDAYNNASGDGTADPRSTVLQAYFTICASALGAAGADLQPIRFSIVPRNL